MRPEGNITVHVFSSRGVGRVMPTSVKDANWLSIHNDSEDTATCSFPLDAPKVGNFFSTVTPNP